MALNQPTNVIPSQLSGLGNGTVDVTQGLNVSWQVNGASPMTAYQIAVFANDTASTQLYTTGKQTLSSPFYGTDQNGDIVRFNAPQISASALSTANIVNGNAYKIIITQWWSSTSSISQTSASPFLARSLPVLELDTLPVQISTRDYTFTATYTQAQGDDVAWVRWQILDSSQNTILDTGNVYTPILQTTYDGFFTGENYRVSCTVQTQNGIEVTTNWKSFSVEYAVQSPSGQISICPLCEQNGIQITWDVPSYPSGTSGLSIYRRQVGFSSLLHLCDVELTSTGIVDYGAASQVTYQYYIFFQGPNTYTAAPIVSEPITPIFWTWAVLECEQDATTGVFNVFNEFQFTLNVETGDVSNNNAPELLQNFTQYPTRQGVSSNYRSGTLQSYIGKVHNNAYEDTLDLAADIYGLSTNTNPKFLKLPRGEIIRIETKSPVSMSTNASQSIQAKYMSLPWVEVGDATGASLVAPIAQAIATLDAVVLTAVDVSWQTGELLWYTPNNYSGGSTLSLNSSGYLVQTTPDNVTPATMSIDNSMTLSATNTPQT